MDNVRVVTPQQIRVADNMDVTIIVAAKDSETEVAMRAFLVAAMEFCGGMPTEKLCELNQVSGGLCELIRTLTKGLEE